MNFHTIPKHSKKRAQRIKLSQAVASMAWVALASTSGAAFAQGAARGGAAVQTTDAGTPEANAREASKLFNEGLKLAGAGKLADAKGMFAKSYEKGQNPKALVNLGVAEMKLGEKAAAAEHFHVYLALPASEKTDDATRALARKNEVELAAGLCAISLHGPTAMIVNVAGREVRGDLAYGEPGAAPHEVRVELTGPVGIKLRIVECKAGARAQADYDEKVEITPPIAVTPPVQTDSPMTPPTYEAPPKEHYQAGKRTTLGYVVPAALAAIGVTGMVLGVVANGSASSAKDDLILQAKSAPCSPQSSPPCAAHQTTTDDVNNAATRSRVFYAVGAVGLLGAVVTYLVWPKDSVRVEGAVGKDSASLVFSGKF